MIGTLAAVTLLAAPSRRSASPASTPPPPCAKNDRRKLIPSRPQNARREPDAIRAQSQRQRNLVAGGNQPTARLRSILPSCEVAVRQLSLPFFPIALLSFCALRISAQSTQSMNSDQTPIFRANARAVLVDVVVTDSHGNPVPGLRQQDFKLTENGKPESVVFFEEHKGAAMVPIELPKMPPNVFTNVPVAPEADALNVLLLDAMNTPQTGSELCSSTSSRVPEDHETGHAPRRLFPGCRSAAGAGIYRKPIDIAGFAAGQEERSVAGNHRVLTLDEG